jgi:putative membrane protein
MMQDWNGPWNHGAGWEGWLMFALVLLFVAAIIVAIVLVVRALAGTTSAPPAAGSPDSPRDILKRRYAASEIDREDYVQRLKDLDG